MVCQRNVAPAMERRVKDTFFSVRPNPVSADVSSLPGALLLMFDTQFSCPDISHKSSFHADSCISALLPF